MTRRLKKRWYRPADVIAVAGLLAALGSPAWGEPNGAQVAHGTASFARNGSLTTITASDNAIINFRSFDIRAGEAVRFVQPSSRSRVLNRIDSPVPTRIDGSLSANGIVYIVNPSGVLFSQGAKIDVAGMFAASGHLSDTDFIKGFDHFTGVAGPVINAGKITAADSVNLIGNYVANSGTISAKNAVVMAVGDDVMVSENPLSGTFVRVSSQPAAAPLGPTARGASAKKASLAAGDLYSLAISQSGTVRAPHVRLESARAGAVKVSGTIDASNPAGKGGKIEVLGSTVELAGATIDASGATGGGRVLVGGDQQGRGDERHARVTTADAATTIRADAADAGDGGRVILWSDERTSSKAAISATGGARSGDGGFAEISSKESLDFSVGPTDLRAARGRSGTLLLDPSFVLIVDGVTGTGDQDAALVTGSGTLAAGASDTVNNTVSWGQIAALTGSTANIVIQATGQITFGNITGATPGVTAVDGTATITRNGAEKLRFEAQGGTITFADLSDRIQITGTGSLELVSSGNMSLARLDALSGTINISAGGSVSMGAMNAQTAIIGAGAGGPGATVTQSSAFGINNLSLQGSADFQFSGQNNNVAVLAGNLSGANSTLALHDDTGFSVGSVAGTSGLSIGTASTNRLLLQTNGLVTQTQPVIVGQMRLLGSGGLQFGAAGNDFGTVAGILAGPASVVTIRDDNGFVIGTVSGTNGLGIGSAAANVLTLQSDGPVTQTRAFVSGSLVMLGAGSYQFGGTNNDANTVAAKLTGVSSSVSLRDDNGFGVGTVGATSGIDIGTGAGNVLSLQSGGGVTQTQPIIGGQLVLLGTGVFTLLGANNNVGVLASNLVGINSVLEFRDDTGFQVGAVSGTNGITIALDPSNRLTLRSDGNVTQTQPINAGAMRLLGNGGFTLSDPGNAIGVLAASLGGPSSSVTLRNNASLSVGTVSTTSGVNIGSGAANQLHLISDGAVTQTTPITAGVLEMTGAGSFAFSDPGNETGVLAAQLTGPSSTLTYRDATGFVVGAGPTVSGLTLPTSAGNTISLTAGGAVTQTVPIVGGALGLAGAGSFTLDTQNNTASSLAASLNGAASSLAFRNDAAILIDTAPGLSGINVGSALANTVTLRSDGGISQNQPITAGGLRLLGAGLGNLTLTSNSVSTVAASLNGAGSALAFSQNGPFGVGAVAGTSGINVGLGAGNLALLLSNTAITQTAPVVAGALTLTGSGSVVLNRNDNDFASLTLASLGGSVWVVSNPTGGLLTVNTGAAGNGATITSLAALRVGGMLTTGPGALLQSGSDGTGDLSFGAGSGIRGADITLRAGDGPGGAGAAGVNAATNTPTFSNAAGTGAPGTFTFRADGPITSAQLPAPAQFTGGSIVGMPYTILSDQGAVSIADATRINTSVLVINGASVNLSDNVSVRTLTTSSPTTLAGSIEVAATTGSLSFGSTLNTGAGSTTLTADEMDFAAGVSGSGALLIRPLGAGVSVGLSGTDIPGRLDLSSAELGRFQAGFSGLTIGNSSGAGQMLVFGSADFKSPVTLRGPGGILLGADVRNQGARITLSNPVQLTADVQVVTTDNGFATGADVNFLDTIDAIAAGNQGLTVAAGTLGAARFGGAGVDRAVGGFASLKFLTVTAGTVTLPGVTTVGSQFYSGPGDVRGDLTSTGSFVTLAGGGTTTGTRRFSAGTVYTHQAALTAGGPLTIISGNDASFTGPTSVTGSLSVTSGRNFTATGLTSATGPISAGANGGISLASVSAGNGLTLTSGTDLAISGPASSTSFISLNSSSGLSTAALTAGTDIVSISNGSAAFGGALSAGGRINASGSSIVATGTLGATTTLDLSASGLISLSQPISAGGIITIGAGTTAGLAQITAGSSLLVNSGGLTTASGPILATGLIHFTTGGLTSTGTVGTQSTFSVNSTGPVSLGNTVTSVGAADITSDSSVALANFSSGPGLTISAGDFVAFNAPAATTGALNVDAGGLTSVAGAIHATGLIRFTTDGLSSTATIDGQSTFSVHSTAPVNLGAGVTAVGAADITGNSSVSLAAFTSGPGLSVSAGAACTFNGPVNTSGALTVGSTGLTSVGGAVLATGPISFTAAGLTSTATIGGQSTFSASSSGPVSLGAGVTAVGAADITSTSTVTLASITSGPGLTINAGGFGAFNGPVTTTGVLTVNAGGLATFAAPVLSTGPIHLTSIGLTSTSTIGGQSTFSVNSTGPVNLGGTVTSVGAADITSNSSVTLASITSGPGLTINAGGFGTFNGPVSTTGALTVNAGGQAAFAAPVLSTGPIHITSVGLTSTSTIDGQSTFSANSTGPVSLGGTVTSVGAADITSNSSVALASFTSGPGLTISAAGPATFGAQVTTTGPLSVNAAGLTSLSTINAASVGVTALGPISTSGLITAPGAVIMSSTASASLGPVNAGTSFGLTASGPASLNGAIVAGGPIDVGAQGLTTAALTSGGAITLASTGDFDQLGPAIAATTLTATATGAERIAAGSRANTSITFQSGADGSGDLAFTAPGVNLDSPVILLRAGDGPGGIKTAIVNALNNSPSFRGVAGPGTSPASFTHRQDGSIVDAQTAAAAQFAGGFGGMSYRLTSDDGGITISDASKFNGASLTVRSAAGFSAVPFSPASLTIEGPLTPGGQTIDVGAGTLTISDAQVFGAADITLLGDEINLPATITGTGRLTIGSGTLARPVLLGGASDSGPGTLDLTAPELDNIVDGFSQITIGRSDASGTLGFAAARQFRDPLVLRVGPGGVMTLDRALSSVGNSSMRFESVLPIRFGTSITTPGRDVTFAGPIALSGDARVTTSGGAINFLSAIDGLSSGVGTLTLQASSGISTFSAPMGANVRPAALTVDGALVARGASVTDSITLGTLRLAADSVFSANVLSFSIITAPTPAGLHVIPTGVNPRVNFGGDVGAAGVDPSFITIDAGGTTQLFRPFRSAGPITFGNTVAFATGVKIIAANAPVTFTGDLTGKGGLTIDSGSGAVDFQRVTTTQPDGPALTLLSSGLSTFNAPATLAAGVVAAGPVRLNSSLTITTTLAPLTFNNSVDLQNATLVSAGDINLGFSAVHAINPLSASSVTSNGGSIRVLAHTDGVGALTFAAPAGSIRVDQPIGAAIAPASIDFSGASLFLPAVRTAGTQHYTGAATLSGNLVTPSATITFSGPVTLAGDITLDTTALSTSPGAAIAIGGTIDSDAATPRGLAVVSGTGVSTLSGNAGQTRALSGLTVVGSSYALAGVRTTGPQNHAGVKTLNGDLAVTTSGGVTLSDQTTLGATVAITTPGAAADNVRIAGTLDDAVAGAHQLSVNSGAAQTLIDATVGSITPPKNLAVTAGSFGLYKLTQTDSFIATSPISVLDSLTSTAGDLIFNAPTVLARDLTLKGQNLTFNATLNGDGGPVTHNIILDSAFLTTFNADVGTIRPFSTITTTSTGATRVAASRVLTFDAQTYANAVIIGADTHLAGSNLNFQQTIDSDAAPHSLNLDSGFGGSVVLAGPVGSTSPLAALRIGAAPFANPAHFTAAGNPLVNSDSIQVHGNISTTGDIVLGGPVDLTGDSIIRSANGNILFRSRIDSDATPRTLSVLTNRDTTGHQPSVPLIKFNGPVGQQHPLANLYLNYLPANLNGGTLIDGRAEVSEVSTVVVADQLDPDGNIPADADVSHSFNLTASNDIIFGLREKLLSIGTVNLRAAGGKIAVGDITAIGDVNLFGNTAIELRRREVGNVLDIAGVSVPDLGVDYVTAGKVNFARPPSPTDAGPEPTFANPTGARGSNSEGFAFRVFTGGIDLGRFIKSNVALALDLRSLGPSDTNVAQAIAGAIPTSDTGSVTTSVVVGAGLRDQLAEIGIFVKDLLPEDVLQMLVGRTLYNDVPTSRGAGGLTAGGNPFADPTLGEYRVSVNRLPTRSVVDVLSAYQSLAYRITKDASGKVIREDLRPQIRDQLLEAWRAFALAESGGKRIRLDARKFRVYLESKGTERTDTEMFALATLEQIKEILARLRAMGLSPVEYQISRNAILSGIAPEQIGTAALGDAAEFDPATATTSQADPAQPPVAEPPPAQAAPASGF